MVAFFPAISTTTTRQARMSCDATCGALCGPSTSVCDSLALAKRAFCGYRVDQMCFVCQVVGFQTRRYRTLVTVRREKPNSCWVSRWPSGRVTTWLGVLAQVRLGIGTSGRLSVRVGRVLQNSQGQTKMYPPQIG